MERSTDREEVAEYLETCMRNRVISESFSEVIISLTKAEEIFALLKEQEAVAPNPVHNSYRWFTCGKCDCSITKEDRFCPRCGRAVKWE